jgi:hypothetical protein
VLFLISRATQPSPLRCIHSSQWPKQVSPGKSEAPPWVTESTSHPYEKPNGDTGKPNGDTVPRRAALLLRGQNPKTRELYGYTAPQNCFQLSAGRVNLSVYVAPKHELKATKQAACPRLFPPIEYRIASELEMGWPPISIPKIPDCVGYQPYS